MTSLINRNDRTKICMFIYRKKGKEKKGERERERDRDRDRERDREMHTCEAEMLEPLV